MAAITAPITGPRIKKLAPVRWSVTVSVEVGAGVWLLLFPLLLFPLLLFPLLLLSLLAVAVVVVLLPLLTIPLVIVLLAVVLFASARIRVVVTLVTAVVDTRPSDRVVGIDVALVVTTTTVVGSRLKQ